MQVDENDPDIKELDFVKIKIIDDFLNLKRRHLMAIEKNEPGLSDSQMIQKENEFYKSLVEQIHQNMVRRQDHLQMLDRNQLLIKELLERNENIQLKQR